MERNRYIFETVVYPSGNKYEAYVPLLDAYTFGDDAIDVMYMAQDLIETIVSCMVEDGEEVPQDQVIGKRPDPDGGFVAMLFTYGDVPEEPDMSVQDAADMLGVTTSRVYALCRNGQLESHKVGTTVMVSAKSVRERFDAEVRPGRPKKEAVLA